MRTLILLVAVLGAALFAAGTATATDTVHEEEPFSLTVNTTFDGPTGDRAFRIDTGDGQFDYNVSWRPADGTAGPAGNRTGLTGDFTVEFGQPGTYYVNVSGQFPHLQYGFAGEQPESDQRKIQTIEQWGDIEWRSFNGSFAGAFNVEAAYDDTPDLSGVTDMSRMFRNARSFNGSVAAWNTSTVTNMRETFAFAGSFNRPVDAWNTGNVTDMSGLFWRATSFDQPLGSWDTSRVTDMSKMFEAAESFDQPLDSWDTGRVTDMHAMFAFARAFNQSLGAWDTGNVTDMSDMFLKANSFDGAVEGWDTGNVTDMSFMFQRASSFNQPLAGWDTGRVTNMEHMFFSIGSSSFNQSLDEWDTGNVTNMGGMFSGADSFQQDISDWCVAQIPDEPVNFDDGAKFESQTALQPDWGAPCDTAAGRPFSLTVDTTANGTTDSQSFLLSTGSGQFDYNLSWEPADGSAGPSGSETGLTGDYTIDFGQSGTYYVNVTGQFPHLRYVTDSRGIPTSDQEKIQTIEQWGDIEWGSFNGSFAGARNVEAAYDDTPDMAAVTDMSGMFEEAESFNGSVAGWETSAVTEFDLTFSDAEAFNRSLDSWDTGNVTTTAAMFERAYAFDRSLDTWDTSNVADMSRMFRGATSFNGSVEAWDTSSVTDMHEMFRNAEAFNRPLGAWDTSSVTDMRSMFEEAMSFQQDISGWCVAQITTKPLLFDFGAEFGDQTALQPDWGAPCDTAAGRPFSLTVDTTFNGTTDNQSFLVGTGTGQFDYDLSWKPVGGTAGPTGNETGLTGDYTIDLGQPGTYYVNVTGQFPHLRYATDARGIPTSDQEKIQTIEQWGDIEWQSFNGSFAGARNVEAAYDDTPDMAAVTDMSGMFEEAESFNGSVAGWETGSVTEMDLTFSDAEAFNRSLDSWDTGNVTTTAAMFERAYAFDRSLDAWDTSNVADMSRMFRGATSFNGSVEAWDTSSVTDMHEMFRNAEAFDRPLDSWDTSNVTDMDALFLEAVSFQRDISGWCVAQISSRPALFDVRAGFEDQTALQPDWGSSCGPPPLTDQLNAPVDVDDDGLYEDVRGSGEFTVLDVQALFDNLDNPTLQTNAAAFAFQNEGTDEVTTLDVQALFNQLPSS